MQVLVTFRVASFTVSCKLKFKSKHLNFREILLCFRVSYYSHAPSLSKNIRRLLSYCVLQINTTMILQSINSTAHHLKNEVTDNVSITGMGFQRKPLRARHRLYINSAPLKEAEYLLKNAKRAFLCVSYKQFKFHKNKE